MNNKIREAAQKFVDRKFETSSITKQEWEAYIEGATFALKEMEQMREAAQSALGFVEELEFRGIATHWTGLPELRAALAATESYFETDKTLKDGKEDNNNV